MNRIILMLAPLIVLGAMIWLFAANIDRDPNFVPSVLINKPVPEFALGPLDDETDIPGIAPDDFGGQVTLVNVFASWCVPCRQEHPILMELAKRDDVAIYGINQKDATENAWSFLNELGNPYSRIGADHDGRASIEWGVYGVPETFIVNADGIITYKHTGPISARSLTESLLPALEAAIADKNAG